MKIGYASRWDPLDKRSWSGTCYYTYQQLQQQGEVEIFQFKLPKLLQEWMTTQKSINRRWFKKHTSVEYLDAYARYFSRQLTRALKQRPVDILFVPASPQLVAYVKTSIPIIYMTDATFQQLQGYYPNFSNLANYNRRQGIALDKKALVNAAHCLLASDWNKDSAIRDYGIAADAITVAPCGANIDLIPPADALVPYTDETFRLLFLGVEWDRKGGDIVLATFRMLQQKGLKVHLHIIGCVPPEDISGDAQITVIPFLDKNDPAQLEKLTTILAGTALLFLPTRAECAGVVFSEAAAWGVPSLSTDTGGVSTYVQQEWNGRLLPMEAGPAEYAAVIESLYHDRDLFNQLKHSSRRYFEQTLDWNNWGKQFAAIAEKLLQQSPART